MERVFYTPPFKRLKVMEDKTLLSMMDAKLSMQRLWQCQDSRVGRTIVTNDTQQRICISSQISFTVDFCMLYQISFQAKVFVTI